MSKNHYIIRSSDILPIVEATGLGLPSRLGPCFWALRAQSGPPDHRTPRPLLPHFSIYLLRSGLDSAGLNSFSRQKKRASFDTRFFSRGDGTRTHGLCVPNAALYQTEPRLATTLLILSEDVYVVKVFFLLFPVSSCFSGGGHSNLKTEHSLLKK